VATGGNGWPATTASLRKEEEEEEEEAGLGGDALDCLEARPALGSR
jgi:hypothetical protein